MKCMTPLSLTTTLLRERVFHRAPDLACQRSPYRSIRAPVAACTPAPYVLAVSGEGVKPQQCFDMTYTDQDGEWTCPDQITLTSGTDCSVLPASCARVGHSVMEELNRDSVVDCGYAANLREPFVIFM